MNSVLLGFCCMVVIHLSVGQHLENVHRHQRRQSWRRVAFNADESSVPTPEDPDGDGVVGAAGKDYPVFREPPAFASEFSCGDRIPGMYADVKSGCQVYHVCQADMRKQSGLCVNGTVFNQETFSCDWWYNVDCSKAPDFYGLNINLGKSYSPVVQVQVQAQQEQQQQQQQDQRRHHLDIHLEQQFSKQKDVLLQPKLIETPMRPLRPSNLNLHSSFSSSSSSAAGIVPVDVPLTPPVPVTPLRVRMPSKKILRRPMFKVPADQELQLQQPQLLNLPNVLLPDDFSSGGRLPPGSPIPGRVTGGGGGQYMRDAFDPALHLPRPKPLSAKKLAAKQMLQQQRMQGNGGRDLQVMKPMMFPVKSDDTVSGYSHLYLNKPVDED